MRCASLRSLPGRRASAPGFAVRCASLRSLPGRRAFAPGFAVRCASLRSLPEYPRRLARAPKLIATALVVVAVPAIAIAAIVDAVTGDGAPKPASSAVPEPGADALEGPFVPAPGALPGELLVSLDDDCRLAAVDLAAGTLEPVDGPPACRLWAAPEGRLAVVSADDERRPSLVLAELSPAPRLLRRLGQADGEPAWAHDGSRVAWCDAAGFTRVIEVAGAAPPEQLPGCAPRFGADGSVLTRLDSLFGAPGLLRDGRVLLDAADLRRAAGGTDRIELLGFDERADGLLAVAVAVFTPGRPSVALGFWRGGRPEHVVELPLRVVPGVGPLGDRLQFGPDGNVLAAGFPGGSFTFVLVDVRSGRQAHPAPRVRGFAWSPDGRWLAIATPDEILVVAAATGETAYSLPVQAAAIAWR